MPAVLGRGELMLSQEGYGHMRRRLSELFLELNAPLPVAWPDALRRRCARTCGASSGVELWAVSAR